MNTPLSKLTKALFGFFYLIIINLFDIAYAAEYPAPQPSSPPQKLQILSSTDEGVMKSLIADFQQQQPSITVEYLDQNSVPLNKKFLADYENNATSDLIISSAMDLQIKLVNDGFADTHSTELLQWLPEWAQWRQQAFGFTSEPAVMVYNKKLLTGDDIPQNRFELIELLRDQTQRFKGRIGTYDIQRSGLGYLFASQDAQQASTWGRLTENLNSVKVKLYDSTSQMLNAVRSGELLLSYNVLGSYAFSAVSESDDLGMILSGDYTLAMSRVAFVSNRARNPKAGHQFLDYLLSERGQRLLAVEARLYPIHPQVSGGATLTGLQQETRNRGPLKLIKLGPALLTYQDQMKKENFLSEWRKVIR
jgi:ABC-type Fe3+ transport system substrate-binding protein